MPRRNAPMKTAQMQGVSDVEIDFSDIPEADATFWKTAKVHLPQPPKTHTNIRLDADVLQWFKAQGRGYQTRMNAVLRSFYEAHKGGSS